MKKVLYLVLMTGSMILMSWTCSDYPNKWAAHPARVLRLECPDTMNAYVNFFVTVDARLSDCEELQLTHNNGRYAPDTTWFRAMANRELDGRRCDTTKPYVRGTFEHRYKLPGKQYLVLETVDGTILDSIYVK